MLKFIINISCVFNLVVIFMLTSSLPVDKNDKTANNNITIASATSKSEEIQNLAEFIKMLKIKYPKLSTFDGSFLNSSNTMFLSNCTIKDVTCMTYFDMLLRLAVNATEESLEPLNKSLETVLKSETFCTDFIAAIPDAPIVPETVISMRMKDAQKCTILCLELNAAVDLVVKPICSLTFLGYRHIYGNSSKLIKTVTLSVPPIMGDSAGIPVPDAKSSATSSAGSDAKVSQSHATESQKSQTNEGKPVPNVNGLQVVSEDGTLKNVASNTPSQLPDGGVQPSVQGNIPVTPNKSVDATQSQSADTANQKNVQTTKVEKGNDEKDNDDKGNEEKGNEVKVNEEKGNGENGHEVQIDQTINIKGDSDKAEGTVLSDEMDQPPAGDLQPDGGIPISNNNVPGNEEPRDEYGDDQDSENDDLTSNERSSETVVKSNDLNDAKKPAPKVDAAYRKPSTPEENHEDQFTQDTDSNFFTYFMFVMALCVMLYVVYHNKTKVLALVLEGRRGSHSGRGIGRRKHTAAYRKLDSNLEEAITSNASGRTTQIIY